MASSIQLQATLEVLRRKHQEQNVLLGQMQNKLNSLKKEMISEEEDVQQLESDTFKSALFKLIRIHDGQLSKEQSEYLKAKRDYENYVFEVSESERLLNQLAQKIKDAENEIQNYKSDIEDRLTQVNQLESHAPQRMLLEKFVAKEKASKSECVEIDEAVVACERACEAQGKAMSLLSSANDWAFWDTWGGGGLITDMVKYDKIEEVQVQFKQLASELSHLQRELSDVGQSVRFDMISMDSTSRGLDIWFDNIFTDLRVKEEIQSQMDSVKLLDHELASVRLTLNQKKEVAEGALKASTEALENFLLDI